MTAMVIAGAEDLRSFLERYDKSFSVFIARRLAARSSTLLCFTNLTKKLAISVFRCVIVSELSEERRPVDWATNAIRRANFIEQGTIDDTGRTARHLIKVLYASLNCVHPSSPLRFSINTAVEASKTLEQVSAQHDFREEYWDAIDDDCAYLAGGADVEDLRTLMLDNAAERPWDSPFARSTTKTLSMTEQWGGDWKLLSDWYADLLNGRHLSTLATALRDTIAKQPPEFWGDVEENPRTPDDVIADIARLTGWSDSASGQVQKEPRPDDIGPQSITAITFAEDLSRPIDLEAETLDPVDDAALQEFEQQLRALLEPIADSGGNMVGACVDHAKNYLTALNETPSKRRSARLWIYGNKLRIELEDNRRRMEARDPLEPPYPPEGSNFLEDVVPLHNIYTADDPICSIYDERARGPTEDRARQEAATKAMAPLIEALEGQNEAVTETAVRVLKSMNDTAQEVKESHTLNADQVVQIAAETDRNFIKALARKGLAYVLDKSAAGLIGVTAIATVSFIAINLDLLLIVSKTMQMSEKIAEVFSYIARIYGRLA